MKNRKKKKERRRKQQEEREEENKEQRSNKKREEEKKQDAPTLLFLQEYKGEEQRKKEASSSCYVYEKNKKQKRRQKDDEELPQFKLISSEELTQEASQPDATNPIPDPPKGTSLHDSIPVGLEQSSDEDEGQKKPTKKKLGWGQRKVWQKIPKADRERIEKHYLSTQPRDIFWAGLNSEKVTNHDLKDIVWDLELSQNVIEAYIQIEEDKIDPMQTRESTVIHMDLGLHAKLRRAILAQGPVNIVEGWLEYIRPQARVFIETKKKPTIVKQKEGPPTLVQKDLTPTEELTLNWIMQNPLQFPFEDDMECAQQTIGLRHVRHVLYG
ncbi:hypothetical protein Prudu_005433 [Prunus dulcis]|uniref:Uncharacterized protein n=1 Tax=Prunus dulcis TaxID=3755 RepID=A0A4Y1QXJ8_PRUDU|nr:hypothetical protein Prudu_005433 [Prunus dulcis]